MTSNAVGAEIAAQSSVATSADQAWAKRYANRLFVTDFIVIVWAVFGSQLAWFGLSRSDAAYFGGSLQALALNYGTVSVVIIVAWTLALGLGATRDSRIIGNGSTEYRRIIDTTVKLFGIFAIVVYLFKIDVARGYIITAFPIGLVVLLAARWLWRQWLVFQRESGEFSARVLLVGSRDSAEHIAMQLASQPSAGYKVVGACTPDSGMGALLRGDVPIVGDLDRIEAAMTELDADTLVVTSSDRLPPARIRSLSWALEPGRQHLIVAPALTDIGGPRIHTRPVAGLPLIHVETPHYEGGTRHLKRIFDVVSAGVLLLLLSLPLAVVALTIKATSPGPVLFKQERVGRNGSRFSMLKFRSMVATAEQDLVSLLDADRAEGNTVMFKMKNDPRVTPIGRFIRRYSIDELPQLFNVLRGDMSLVGPRPPLPREVEKYESHVNRRFLVQPGLTGLWQVSGRSNLSWEDTVRLDLYYVENWSLATDLIILLRTARAVMAREGAY